MFSNLRICMLKSGTGSHVGTRRVHEAAHDVHHLLRHLQPKT